MPFAPGNTLSLWKEFALYTADPFFPMAPRQLKKPAGNEKIPDKQEQDRQNGNEDPDRWQIKSQVADAGSDPQIGRGSAEDIALKHHERNDQTAQRAQQVTHMEGHAVEAR